jgi:hypothetical protein
MPQVDRRAVEALKFGDCLPHDLLRRVVKARWSDTRAVRHTLGPSAQSDVLRCEASGSGMGFELTEVPQLPTAMAQPGLLEFLGRVWRCGIGRRERDG